MRDWILGRRLYKRGILNRKQYTKGNHSIVLRVNTTNMASDLYKPRFIKGRYENPEEWSSDQIEEQGYSRWKIPDKIEFLQMRFGKDEDKSNIPSCKDDLDNALPVNKEDFNKLKSLPKDGIQVMWIGHATVVVQFDGITILTDPIFSHRCSPVQLKGVGCARYREVPCNVEDLPKIDAVLISHDHYDHLDHESVKALDKRFGSELHWFVPMGLKSWFQSKWGLGMFGLDCKKVTELTWWEDTTLSLTTNDKTETFTFVCTPAQHWCQRGINDLNKNLWCSWVVKSSRYKFFFAGDTGYCPAFKQIGEQHGPFHLAAIPIGAYEPRWYMSPQHVSPEQAVEIFVDINRFNPPKLKNIEKDASSNIGDETVCEKIDSSSTTNVCDVNVPLDVTDSVREKSKNEECDISLNTEQKETWELVGTAEEIHLESQTTVKENVRRLSFEPKFVGIHWGTFKQLGCYEHYLEPPKLVQKKMGELGIPSTCFPEVRHGKVRVINFPSK